METGLAKAKPIELRTVEDLGTLADYMLKAGMAPKGVNRPAALGVMILAGREVGLGPIASMNSIVLVNGRATLYGDAALALVRASNLLGSIEEKIEGTGDKRVAICSTRRMGDNRPRETRFSVEDAKQAGLLPAKPDSPWTKYPDRMLMFRARSWNLRDNFGDVLMGLGIFEEAQDTPIEVTVSQAEPAAPPKEAKADNKPVTESQLRHLVELKGKLAEARGITEGTALKAMWADVLKPHGVESAKSLSSDAAMSLTTAIELELGITGKS